MSGAATGAARRLEKSAGTFDTREFRDALGQFATGVCIVTVVPNVGSPLGITVNSFAAVSLEPPLVLWSLNRTSNTFDAFQNANRFAINIVASDQLELCQHYASKQRHGLREDDFVWNEHGDAVIEGALSTFACVVDARHDGGDHEIIVGRVDEVSVGEVGSEPLLFFGGEFGDFNVPDKDPAS